MLRVFLCAIVGVVLPCERRCDPALSESFRAHHRRVHSYAQPHADVLKSSALHHPVAFVRSSVAPAKSSRLLRRRCALRWPSVTCEEGFREGGSRHRLRQKTTPTVAHKEAPCATLCAPEKECTVKITIHAHFTVHSGTVASTAALSHMRRPQITHPPPSPSPREVLCCVDEKLSATTTSTRVALVVVVDAGDV